MLKFPQSGALSLGTKSGSPVAQKIIIASRDRTQTTQANLVNQLIRSNSPVQVISRTGLSGGKIVTTTSPLTTHVTRAPVTQTIVHSQSNSYLSQLTNTVVSSLASPSIIKSCSTGNLSDLNGSGTSIIKRNLTNKDLSRIWSNEDIKLKSISPTAVSQIHVSISISRDLYSAKLIFRRTYEVR